jgi:transcription elongation factor GreA
VIDQSKLNEKIIEIGHTVLVRELPDGENETFSIVGSAEVDPLDGKISPESPIAKQMLGKQVGDEIKVKTPNGEMLFLIVTIS